MGFLRSFNGCRQHLNDGSGCHGDRDKLGLAISAHDFENKIDGRLAALGPIFDDHGFHQRRASKIAALL